MEILCLGLSHQTAPVELRERLALSSAQTLERIAALRALWPGIELVILSTCNRTEYYLARPLDQEPDAQMILDHLAQWHTIPRPELSRILYHHTGQAAVEHLFNVAGGLDSMVLGEYQILGQVREAYQAAHSLEAAGRCLHPLFQSALAAGKKLRTETAIGEGRLSVGSVAVEFARHLFDRMEDKTLLCIGAGKMTELTLRHFAELKPGKILIANRSMDKARELAGAFSAQAVDFFALADHLVAADIIISCTGASQPIISRALFQKVIKRRRSRPVQIIDIAMPRDFEPSIAQLDSVYLYNLDDLQRVVADNQQQRRSETEACRRIIRREVEDCCRQLRSHELGALIRNLRHQLLDLAEAEAQRAARRLASATPEQFQDMLNEHAHRLVNKMLHKPLAGLGQAATDHSAHLADAIRYLFDLEQQSATQADHPAAPPASASDAPRPDSSAPASEGLKTQSSPGAKGPAKSS